MTERGHRLAKGISTRTRPKCQRTQAYSKGEEEETWKGTNQQSKCRQARGDSEDAVGRLLRGMGIPSVCSSHGMAFDPLACADPILYASLGFTPYLSCIQAFPIYSYDEECGRLLESGAQKHRHAQSTARPQRRAICRTGIRERLQRLLSSYLMVLDQWLTPPRSRRVAQGWNGANIYR